MEIHPSSMVVLPEESEGALNVLELVIQPADGKIGISYGSGGITADNTLNRSAATLTSTSENTVRTSGAADGDSTAVEAKFTEKLPEIAPQRFM